MNRKNLLLAISLPIIFGLIGAGVSLLFPNVYRSTATLMVSPDEDGIAGFSSVTASASSLFKGVLGGTQDVTKRDYVLSLLESRTFLVDFVKSNNLVVDLIASERWNEKSDRIDYDQSRYDPDGGIWLQRDGKPSHPTEEEIYFACIESLFISEDRDTGVVYVGFEHVSPKISKKITEQLISSLNEYVRNSAIVDSQKKVDFLKSQLSKYPENELKQTVFTLLERELNRSMLANVTNEYAVKIIDSPYLPEKRNRPNRVLIASFSFLFGVLVLFAYFWLIALIRE